MLGNCLSTKSTPEIVDFDVAGLLGGIINEGHKPGGAETDMDKESKKLFGGTIDFPVWNSLLKTYCTATILARKPIAISTSNNQLQNHKQLDAFKLKFYSTTIPNDNPKNIDSHVKSAKAALKKIKRKNDKMQ